MKNKQEHQGTGDNVGGNKYEIKSFVDSSDIHSKLNSKIEVFRKNEELDFDDNIVITALKEVVQELIQQEQSKAHQLVPLGKIRTQFKSIFDDDSFNKIIKELIEDGQIEVESSQVCFTKRQINYKINI